MNPNDHKAATPAQKAAGSLSLSALALSYHPLGAHGETPSSNPPELPGETKAISATPSTPNLMQDAALVSYKDSELRTMIKSSRKLSDKWTLSRRCAEQLC